MEKRQLFEQNRREYPDGLRFLHDIWGLKIIEPHSKKVPSENNCDSRTLWRTESPSKCAKGSDIHKLEKSQPI